MAKLDQEKIRQLWEKPKNKPAIDRAARDNERQLFHAQLCYEIQDSTSYLPIFLDKVRRMLNNSDKYRKFENLLTFPLPSNHLISKATDEWNKVFKAQDRVEEYRFTDETLNGDFQAFLEKINFNTIVEQNLFTKVKQAVNTIAVVDVSVDPSADATEPYVYFVETGACKDVDVDHSGAITYLLFERGSVANGDRQLVVIDEDFYRVFDIEDQSRELTLVTESKHYLGYCPATFIWSDVIDPDNMVRRFNSVSEIVDKLDRYVIADIFGQHIDLYASFPILWQYENDCGPDLPPEKDQSDPLKEGFYGTTSGPEDPYTGPGWQIAIKVPDGDNVTMAPPVGFVEPKTVTLEYNKNKIRNLEVEIIKHLTGVDNEIQNEKAFNESQIRSQYETRHSVLRYWAENMQAAHKFIVSAIAKLRYRQKFVSVSIDYGMDYFLYDTITATTDYKDAKDAGLPMYIVASRREVVMQIETRNSPNKKARFEVLAQLEPYLDIDISKIDRLTPEYELKSNFQSYIDRFERENGDIVTFGSAIDFNDKIIKIKSKLYDYVKETRDFQQKNSLRGEDIRQSGQGTEVRIPASVG